MSAGEEVFEVLRQSELQYRERGDRKRPSVKTRWSLRGQGLLFSLRVVVVNLATTSLRNLEVQDTLNSWLSLISYRFTSGGFGFFFTLKLLNSQD